MIEELIKLATHLDEEGHLKEADHLDSIISVASGDSSEGFLYQIVAKNNEGTNLLGSLLGYEKESDALFFTSEAGLEDTLLDIVLYLEDKEPHVFVDPYKTDDPKEMARLFMENHMGMYGFEHTPNIITKKIYMSSIKEVVLND